MPIKYVLPTQANVVIIVTHRRLVNASGHKIAKLSWF